MAGESDRELIEALARANRQAASWRHRARENMGEIERLKAMIRELLAEQKQDAGNRA